MVQIPTMAMSRLSPQQLQRLVAVAAVGGGGALALQRISRVLAHQRRTQRALASAAEPSSKGGASARQPRVAVDARFARRLLSILRICVPGMASREAALVVLQGCLLLSRTMLSDAIARLEGVCGEKVTAQDWVAFRVVLKNFALVAVPASIVNSGLKAVQILIQLAFRKRLTRYLHKLYLANRAYYSAAVLGGLGHADQRLTDDVEKFCETLSELYSRTFKPLLDIIVFTRSLARIIGYKGQLCLYTYFIIIGAVLRALSPPLGLMTAQYSGLNGAFRTAHSRIAASAEEIAFNDPPAGGAEMNALNSRLDRMVHHSSLTACQRFIQSCLDGYATKYTASIIGLVIFAVPLYMRPVESRGTTSEIAGQYINTMRLMMQSASAMGQLVLVYKRVNTLAGHTARVSELLEQVRELGKPNGRLTAFQRAQARVESNGVSNGDSSSRSNGICLPGSGEGKSAKMVNGSNIKLEDVSLWAPDGTLLIRELNLDVPAGSSVIIEGPNGSGKTGLLRMLGGLWPLQSGTVTLPARNSIFFLSQRPYIFADGSLAEQLMYPNLPGVVIGEDTTFDSDFAEKCLVAVELRHLIDRASGFNGVLAWDDILSGGERNRLAVARLLYHRPKFAVLDECTAAVSADGEMVLYKAMAEAGISLLSVAHRKAVRAFHQYAIVLDGNKGWEWKNLAEEEHS